MVDVDAVLLDLGGVFYLPDHDRMRCALTRLGVDVDPEHLDRAHYEGVAALRAPNGTGDPALDHHGDGTSLWHAYNRAYARVCGVEEGALDDATTVLLEEFGRHNMWTRVIPDSREALVEMSALDALKISPERTIHVGDTPAADVQGALAAGVRPVLIDPFDLHPDAPWERARSLSEVAARLRTAKHR